MNKFTVPTMAEKLNARTHLRNLASNLEEKKPVLSQKAATLANEIYEMPLAAQVKEIEDLLERISSDPAAMAAATGARAAILTIGDMLTDELYK